MSDVPVIGDIVRATSYLYTADGQLYDMTSLVVIFFKVVKILGTNHQHSVLEAIKPPADFDRRGFPGLINDQYKGNQLIVLCGGSCKDATVLSGVEKMLWMAEGVIK